MTALRIGLAYDLFGSYPLRPGDPPDAEVEYEPEATVLVLEAALRRLGTRAPAPRQPPRRAPGRRAGAAAAPRRGPHHRRGLRPAESRGVGPRALRDGGHPGPRIRRPDPVDDPRQALGASRRRRGRRAGAGAREPGLARGGGDLVLAGAVPALRQAALGRHRQGHRPELAGREPRGPRARGRSRRHDLRAAGPRRGVPRGAGVHGHAGGPRAAPGLAHAPAGAGGLDRHRGPRARAASAAARGLAPRHARARSTLRSRPSWSRWRSGRSRRSSAAISPAPTSAWTAAGGLTSSR